MHGHVFHHTKWPKSWSNIEDPVVPLERILYGHPLAALVLERQFKEVLLGLGWSKSTELGVSVCSLTTRIVLIGIRECDIKNVWKKAEYGSHVEEMVETC